MMKFVPAILLLALLTAFSSAKGTRGRWLRELSFSSSFSYSYKEVETQQEEGCEKEYLNTHVPPIEGYLNTNCSFYDLEIARDWIPDAYLENAKCACSRIPNCGSANCARQRIQWHHENYAAWLAPEVVEEAKRLKKDGWYFQYNSYVQENLSPYFKALHDEAYEYCGCKGTFYSDLVTRAASIFQPTCMLSDMLIKTGASCHSTPGYW